MYFIPIAYTQNFVDQKEVSTRVSNNIRVFQITLECSKRLEIV